MPIKSGWIKAGNYVSLLAECTSSFVVASCLGIAGKAFVKNPVMRVAWYIGSVAIATVVSDHIGKEVEANILETGEAVAELQAAIKEVKDSLKD